MIYVEIIGLWLFLGFAILRANHRAHSKKTPHVDPRELPPMYYANRYGVYRYSEREMRRLELEYDLMERERL